MPLGIWEPQNWPKKLAKNAKKSSKLPEQTIQIFRAAPLMSALKKT